MLNCVSKHPIVLLSEELVQEGTKEDSDIIAAYAFGGCLEEGGDVGAS